MQVITSKDNEVVKSIKKLKERNIVMRKINMWLKGLNL